MSFGAAASLPAASVAAYDPSNHSTVLNSGAAQAGYYDRVATLSDISGNAHHATQATDLNRPRYIKHTGDNYLFQTAQTHATNNPNIAYYSALNIAADMVVEVSTALHDWATASVATLAARIHGGANAAWSLQVQSNAMKFTWFSAGTHTVTSSTTFAIAANTRMWMRVEYIKNTGSGSYSVKFFTSSDGVTYGQLGATMTGASTGDISDTVSSVSLGIQELGTNGGALQRLYSCKLSSGTIASNTVVMDWRASDSSHFANTGSLNTGSGIVSYGTTRNVLIGRSVLYMDAASATQQMDVASPFPMNYTPGGYACGFRVFGVPSTSKLPVFGIDIAQVPYPAMIYTATDCLCADALRNFTKVTAGFTGNQTIITRIESNLGAFYQNGVNTTAIATAAYSYVQSINKLFRRGTDYHSGGAFIDRMAVWAGNVTHPTSAVIAGWLA
jgi:hypothetical protein